MKGLHNILLDRETQASSTDSKSITSVSIREGTPAIALITWEQGTWVLPWIHFLYALHEPDPGTDRIKLFFSSHEITLEGNRLQLIIDDITKMRIEWVKNYDKRYALLCPQSMAFVENIMIVTKKAESVIQSL